MKQDCISTDQLLRELAVHGAPQFPIRYYIDDSLLLPNHSVERHWHPEFECALVLEGSADYRVGDRNILLKKGEGVFINSTVLHGSRTDARERTLVPNIVFSPSLIAAPDQEIYRKFVTPFLSSSISCLPLRPSESWQGEILDLLSEAFRLFETGSPTLELDVRQAVSAMWRLIFLHREDCLTQPQCAGVLTMQGRLKLMLEFLYQNFSGKITLQQLADAASISKNEALRCFRKGMGCSPMEYLTRYRLEKGRELLSATDLPITEIALSSGFESVSYFDRTFKKVFGMTPKAFRKARP